MLRRWTLFAFSLCAVVAANVHAQSGTSLADRLRILTGSNDQQRDQPMRDGNVRPAAAAGRPQAARDTAMNGATRRPSSGTSLFSRLRLPRLMPQSDGAADEQLSDAPMPYDAEEMTPPSRRRAAPRQITPPNRAATSAPGRRSAEADVEGATASPSVATRVRTGAAPGPRVVRSSPRSDNRHNELAEALTGLRDRQPADATVEEAESDVEPPPATHGEEAPSYMAGDEPTTAGAASSARRAASASAESRGWSRGPLDVRDALASGEGSGERATAPVGRTPAPRRNSGPAPAALRTPPAVPQRSARTAPVVDANDVANALRDDAAGNASTTTGARASSVDPEEEVLGDIAAEAPPAYEAVPRPTAPVLPSGAGAKGSRPVSRPVAGIGNLRPKRPDVLATCRQPVLVSSVEGPARIIVGRQAQFRVVVENKGDHSARETTATVCVPSWAEVIEAAATNGAVDRLTAGPDAKSHTFKWQLYELAAGASQTLTIDLIPRDGRSLELSVECTHAPVTSQAVVEVAEPRLEMEIAGPGEVLFGKSQRYTLTLANPGTGDAEDVLIELVPPGGDAGAPVRHKLGILPAGVTKSIELELTAREAGELHMQAAAIAAGDLRTEAIKTVLCRKAQLDVQWRGPDKNFAGAVATYFIRVRNPGTAPADQVGVELTLPSGGELVDASAGYSFDAERRTIAWKAGALAANEERFMQLRCRLTTPGKNEMALIAKTAAGDLSDVHNMPVTVEALADLKLLVSDPQGVVPVGETATYEIRVQNRGMTAARGVNVVAMFSDGIEPTHVEGGQHEIRDGRVSFRSIDALPAGAEAVLRIQAKAVKAGTHVFRAEVVCDDLDTKLAAEETTRFFVDEDRWADASAAYAEQADGTTR